MKITAEQIPPEVVEAASKAFTDAMLAVPQPDPIRAAIAAGLASWPDRHLHEWQRPWLGGMSGTDIILPLTEAGHE